MNTLFWFAFAVLSVLLIVLAMRVVELREDVKEMQSQMEELVTVDDLCSFEQVQERKRLHLEKEKEKKRL
jgi:membrane protein implicated in regulation of membrane protease activity